MEKSARARWEESYSYNANLKKLYKLINGGDTNEIG